MAAGNPDYLALFQSYLLAERHLARNSVMSYMLDIAKLERLLAGQGTASLFEATPAHLKAYVRSLHTAKAQPRTIARKISSMKVFFGFLADRFGIANSAADLVVPKIDKTLPVFLTHDEIKAMMQTALLEATTSRGKRNALMLQLLYATGLRITELITLRLENINFDTGFLNVIGKGGRQRDIPLPLVVCEQLQNYVDTLLPESIKEVSGELSPKLFLFPLVRNKKIKPITRQAFWIILKKILAASGVHKNVSPHTLRHSIATHLLQAGADIRSLQLLLGHERMSTVEIYTHLDKSMVRKAYDKKHPRA